MSATDKTQHALQDAQGKVEEGVGRAIGDDRMRAEGKGDQLAAQTKRIADKVGDGAKRGGRTITAKVERWVSRFHERLHEEAGSKLGDPHE